MLRIHLFGQLRLTYDEQPWKFAAPPRTLPLWMYLLLHRAAPLARNHLAFTLWPDSAESAARGNLRRHLHELRRALPPAPKDRPWLLTEADGVQWNPESDYWLDVAAFEELRARPGTLAEAVAVVEGDLLPGLYEDWAIFERERLRNDWLESAGRLAAQCRERGDLADAMHYTRLILLRDPLREEAVRDLIALRHESGDRAGAMLEFQRFAERLREELGVEPLPETAELYERLKAEGARRPGSLAARPVPAPASAAPVPHNLPGQLTTFLGRAAELETILGLLAPPAGAAGQGARLLTLTGPGGAGKTRLSLEAAARLLRDRPDAFPDGLFFVNLSEVADPELVSRAVAQTLGLAESGGQTPEETLQTYLRGRRLLLILDNFEQVVAAGGFVADLLAAAPDVRALVTSRAVLRVYGETEFAVPPLGLPNLAGVGSLPLADLLAYPAVALFVERVRAARPDFELTAENAAAVAEICVRLDGLPLALELAAARSKLLTLQAMLARLASRLSFLTSGPRNLAARQQTLRQTIDWSYQLLDEAEQTLFARLGVCAGGFNVAAAEALAGGPAAPDVDMIDRLAGLADKSMLRIEPGPGDEPRFRMLLTLREFALDRLAANGAVAALREAHARYYLAVAEQAGPGPVGAGQAAPLAGLEPDHDNFRAALDWCAQTPAGAEPGLRLAVALGPFWYQRSEFREGQNRLETALAAWPDAPPALRAAALSHLGAFQRDRSDYAEAQETLEASRDLWQTLGADGKTGLAWALRNLGMLAFQQRELPLAERYHSAGLALQRELGNTLGIAAALNGLVTVANARRDTASVIAYAQESLPLARAAGDRQLVGDVLNNLGIAEQEQGNFAEARAYLAEALEAYQAVGDRYGQAIALNNLSNAARPQGDLDAARAYAAESVALYNDAGTPAKSARPLYHLGAAALLQGDLSAAAECFSASLKIHLERNFADGELEAIEGFARLALARSQPERAARLLAAAATLRAARGTPLRTVPSIAEQEQTLAAIRAALPPQEFEAAWAAGAALTLEQAGTLALDSAAFAQNPSDSS